MATKEEIEKIRTEAHALLELAEAVLRDLVGLTSDEHADVAWAGVEKALNELDEMAKEAHRDD